MTCRATGRGRVLVSRAVHPHYREVLRTYVDGAGLDVDDVPIVEDGRLAAIVSIGDVVKQRINALRSERDQLASYINQ